MQTVLTPFLIRAVSFSDPIRLGEQLNGMRCRVSLGVKIVFQSVKFFVARSNFEECVRNTRISVILPARIFIREEQGFVLDLCKNLYRLFVENVKLSLLFGFTFYFQGVRIFPVRPSKIIWDQGSRIEEVSQSSDQQRLIRSLRIKSAKTLQTYRMLNLL